MKTTLVSGLLATALALSAVPAMAGAFWGATVTGVAYDDELNVRRWPSPSSRIIDSYENGDSVSLTGKCRSVAPGWSVNLDDATSRAERRAWVKRHWCEVYTEGGRIGWVRGKFLRVQ